MNETLKGVAHIGAELAAAKADLQREMERHRKTWRQLEQVTALLREIEDEVLLDNSTVARIQIALSQQAEPVPAQDEQSPIWGYAWTIGNLIAQLRTLNPDMEIYSPHRLDDGRIVLGGFTLSKEWKEGRWLRKGDDAKRVAVLWTQPDARPAQTAPRCQCCGYLVTDSEHRGCLRAAPIAQTAPQGKFRIGDLVKKISGSEWEGHICGTYSTELTPEGYAVESAAHRGSVQIYPAKALELVPSNE